jgi:ribosomal protein S18 acetylase RimI-like enzyme
MPTNAHFSAPVTVRIALPEHAPELARVHRAAALAGFGHIFPAESPAPTHDELLELWNGWLAPCADPRHQALAAYAGTEVVGTVLAMPDPSDADLGHLARLYVSPDRWGCGIGRQLYEAAVDALRAARFTSATLWVLEHDLRARSWYERLGWQPTEVRKPVYAPAGIDDLRYEIRL